MSRLTKIDAARGIEQLIRAGYTVPKEVGADATAEVWVEHLGDLDHADVAAAVLQYVRGDEHFWPKPGKIRWLVTEIRKQGPGRNPLETGELGQRYAAWERHQDHSTVNEGGRCVVCAAGCPICRAVVQWIPASRQTGGREVYAVLHDPREHERANVPHVGFPLPDWAVRMYAAAEPAKPKTPGKGIQPMPEVDPEQAAREAEWRRQQRAQLEALQGEVQGELEPVGV